MNNVSIFPHLSHIALNSIWIVDWTRFCNWSTICLKCHRNRCKVRFWKSRRRQTCNGAWWRAVRWIVRKISWPAVWSKWPVWLVALWLPPRIFDNSRRVSAKIATENDCDEAVCGGQRPLRTVWVIMSDQLAGVCQNHPHRMETSIARVYRYKINHRWVVKKFGKIPPTATHRYNRLTPSFTTEAEIMAVIRVWIRAYRAVQRNRIYRVVHARRNGVWWASSSRWHRRKAAKIIMTPMDRWVLFYLSI